MKKMTLGLIVFVLVLCFSVYSCSAAPASGAPSFKGTVSIGSIAQMTGVNAVNGVQVTQGIQLLLDQVNAAGGVQGYEVKLVAEDSANDTDTAINGVNRLLANKDVVAAIGPQQSAQVFAVANLLKNDNMPLIVAGTNPGIPELALDNKNLFSGRANDSVMARIAAIYLHNLGLKKIGVLHASEDFGMGGMQTAVEYFEEVGQDYVVETFNNDDSDFTGSIMRVRNAGVDGLFVWCLNAPYVILCRQLYEQGVTLPVASNASGITSTVLSLVDIEWLEGWCMVGDYVPTNPNPKVQEFKQQFEAKYNMATDLISGCYYDMANVLLYAMENLCDDPTDRASVGEALRKLDGQFTGMIGTYYCDETQQMMFETSVIQIQEGVPTFLELVNSR